MPLHIIVASGSAPAGWTASKGGTIKYPVRNQAVRRHLHELAPGRWQKVIKLGNSGEVHYFEHASGKVAGVKFFPKDPNA